MCIVVVSADGLGNGVVAEFCMEGHGVGQCATVGVCAIADVIVEGAY